MVILARYRQSGGQGVEGQTDGKRGAEEIQKRDNDITRTFILEVLR
jgi:hypothetical protein